MSEKNEHYKEEIIVLLKEILEQFKKNNEGIQTLNREMLRINDSIQYHLPSPKTRIYRDDIQDGVRGMITVLDNLNKGGI